MKLILQKANVTLYESEPQWRTIKYKYTEGNFQGKTYLYFPYLQFMFLRNAQKTFFQTFASQKPYPDQNILLDANFRISCLGDGWIVKDHNHQQNIHQYWNSTFLINNYDSFNNFKTLSNLYKEKLYEQKTQLTIPSVVKLQDYLWD